ncbi:DUF1501 domain-containing protein [Pendulispora rubella]|uniref:DUF1501 domain-containing protein n=1 Tax=Pendulispora rubella TaxID=2741070 RepID=A0ABZ2LBA1_9BACT
MKRHFERHPFETSRTDTLRLGRRALVGGLAGTLGALLLSRRARGDAATPSEPHFFMQVLVQGGLDAAYSFDALPLEMTAAGLQQNYIGAEPAPWEGADGTRTLVAAPTQALRPFLQDLAIVNGVLTSVAFDGHGQNRNLLLTGNPFGGVPAMSRLNTETPIDYVQVGAFVADVRDARFVPLNAETAAALQATLSSSGKDTPDFDAHLQARCSQAASSGANRFSNGARVLGGAAAQSVSLAERIRALQLPAIGALAEPDFDVALDRNLAMIGEFFRHGITKSCLLDITGDMRFDTHSADEAKNQAPMYEAAAKRFARVLAYLKKTPFDERRTLLDVTTVMFASEFGRTMRRVGYPVDDTGTDHNTLASTILLAGRGIAAGRVFGGTDFRTPTEELSSAHLSLDPSRIKRMGLPIDFATGRSTDAKPAQYESGTYLGLASVVNALYSLFGVDRQFFWEAARNEAAPTFNALLKR